MNSISSKKKEKKLNKFFKKPISELRDTMTEPKNSIENFNKRFEQTEGKKINKFKDKLFEIIQRGEEKEICEESLYKLWIILREIISIVSECQKEKKRTNVGGR